MDWFKHHLSQWPFEVLYKPCLAPIRSYTHSPIEGSIIHGISKLVWRHAQGTSKSPSHVERWSARSVSRARSTNSPRKQQTNVEELRWWGKQAGEHRKWPSLVSRQASLTWGGSGGYHVEAREDRGREEGRSPREIRARDRLETQLEKKKKVLSAGEKTVIKH